MTDLMLYLVIITIQDLVGRILKRRCWINDSLVVEKNNNIADEKNFATSSRHSRDRFITSEYLRYGHSKQHETYLALALHSHKERWILQINHSYNQHLLFHRLEFCLDYAILS